MPSFPSHVHLSWRDCVERPEPTVIASQMERGVPVHRRIAADSLVRLSIVAVFASAQRAEDFESWFYGEINAGADSFDFVHPRTKQTVEARIVGGDIGELRPLGFRNGRYSRGFQLSYVRPGFKLLPPGRHAVSPSRILSVQSDLGTVINGSGGLVTVPANTARYEGGQLLVEEARANLLEQSTAMLAASIWAPVRATKEAATLMPLGVAGVFLREDNEANNSHSIIHNKDAAVVGGQPYTFSIFATNAGRRYLRLRLDNINNTPLWNAVTPVAVFDLDTGSMIQLLGAAENPSLTAGVTTIAPGVRRCWITAAPLSNGVIRPQCFMGAINSFNYDGDGVSGIVFAAPQLEMGAGPSNFIPTAGAPVHRSADLVTVSV